VSYFNRQTTLAERQIARITEAYAVAGVQPPNRTTEALEAIATAPGAADVAAEVARGAFTTEDVAQYVDDALDRIARAQAADALRAAVAKVSPQIRREQMPGTLAQAVRDLEPAFAKTAGTLAAAAQKLDQRKPLEPDNAIRDDTTRQLKQAQAALTDLGAYATMFVQPVLPGVPPALARVLPIVALPECVVEVWVESLASQPETLNAEACAGTYAVRDLSRELERDIDAALVAVARGDFPGVILALGDSAEQRRRAVEAGRASNRRTAKPHERGKSTLVTR
jgi:hypothetical protein